MPNIRSTAPVNWEDVAGLAQEAQVTAAQVEERLDTLEKQMPELVRAAVSDSVRGALQDVPRLTEEEREFVKLACRREARREKLHQAIIEKTVSALIWSVLAALVGTFAFLVADYVRTHFHFSETPIPRNAPPPK